MPGISYDDNGSLAGYFGVTFLAVVLIPATWIVCKPAQKGASGPPPHLRDLSLSPPLITRCTEFSVMPHCDLQLKECILTILEPLQPLCDCSECKANFTQIAARKSSTHRKRFIRRIVPLVLAWSLFGYLCYVVANAPRGIGGVVYNPFEILGLRDTSTEKEIKKHYKKLSLKL